MRWLAASIVFLTASFANAPAMAEAVSWQMGLQGAVSPIMDRIASFHHLLLWIITIVTLFVLGLLIYVCVNFREEKNPTPSRRSHHTMLEVVWTAVPVLILIIIAIPSFKLLYYSDIVPKTDMTVKATGHQWYWSYEYPDNGDFGFDAYLIADEDLQEGQKRLLETDNRVVLPANTNIRIQVTSADVLHSWAMPPMGIKIDAVPGRLNEVWVNIEEPGTYYGQCSELCGVNHGFMPITIEALPKAEFDAWVETAKQQFARADGVTTRVADASAAVSNAK
ncbi:MAG: cytochrome c oxidase subunit II [Geminicoccaceae bacterium]|nr:cytochrome c oxidase subunit II [Geminicoccaceae bacterium]MCB9943290.1 cytochrome c oxidase subunit II [Geminicoccaceae bacterium]